MTPFKWPNNQAHFVLEDKRICNHNSTLVSFFILLLHPCRIVCIAREFVCECSYRCISVILYASIVKQKRLTISCSQINFDSFYAYSPPILCFDRLFCFSLFYFSLNIVNIIITIVIKKKIQYKNITKHTYKYCVCACVCVKWMNML